MSASSVRREQRREALTRQTTRLQRRLTELTVRAERLSWVRLLLFLGGFAVSGALFFLRGPLEWLVALVVWLAPFVYVVAAHRRLDAAIRRYQLWLDLKRAQLARMALDWTALPPPASLPPPPLDHPFANDLDLSGERSLHHLIDTTVTFDGSLRLQQRLLDRQPSLQSVQQRQGLVRALRPLSLFRDRLALQALLARQESGKPWQADALLAWVQAPAAAQSFGGWVLALTILGALNAVLFALAQVGILAPIWAGGLVLYFALYLLQGRAARSLFNDALALHDALQQMGVVFGYLERPRFQRVQPLSDLLAPLRDGEVSPSHYLRAISRVVAAAGLSRNPVLWMLLNVVFPWDLFFAHRLQRLRADIAGRLPRWLNVWFELEAASALANLAYLNPAYTFPTVHDNDSSEIPFSAQDMGHPLIVHEEKVCNDYTISHLGELHIITGSNMAGKSSFLRTIGVNLCLAYAGCAVDAAELQTGLFRLFSAIRVTDSVTDGISYFYAEVKRLKALLEALQSEDPRPLFFLIDEIFRGTNNRERLLGSRAYIRALVGQHGVGLIATHDLELVQLAQEMEQVSNFHFRDSVSGGRMVFDYRLRSGPSPTTNALKVMAEAGLPVPQDRELD